MTRRLIILLALAVLAVALIAAPAVAQQEPYGDTDVLGGEFQLQQPGGAEQIPRGGIDAATLALAAVGLTGVGGAALLVARARRSHS